MDEYCGDYGAYGECSFYDNCSDDLLLRALDNLCPDQQDDLESMFIPMEVGPQEPVVSGGEPFAVPELMECNDTNNDNCVPHADHASPPILVNVPSRTDANEYTTVFDPLLAAIDTVYKITLEASNLLPSCPSVKNDMQTTTRALDRVVSDIQRINGTAEQIAVLESAMNKVVRKAVALAGIAIGTWQKDHARVLGFQACIQIFCAWVAGGGGDANDKFIYSGCYRKFQGANADDIASVKAHVARGGPKIAPWRSLRGRTSSALKDSIGSVCDILSMMELQESIQSPYVYPVSGQECVGPVRETCVVNGYSIPEGLIGELFERVVQHEHAVPPERVGHCTATPVIHRLDNVHRTNVMHAMAHAENNVIAFLKMAAISAIGNPDDDNPIEICQMLLAHTEVSPFVRLLGSGILSTIFVNAAVTVIAYSTPMQQTQLEFSGLLHLNDVYPYATSESIGKSSSDGDVFSLAVEKLMASAVASFRQDPDLVIESRQTSAACDSPVGSRVLDRMFPLAFDALRDFGDMRQCLANRKLSVACDPYADNDPGSTSDAICVLFQGMYAQLVNARRLPDAQSTIVYSTYISDASGSCMGFTVIVASCELTQSELVLSTEAREPERIVDITSQPNFPGDIRASIRANNPVCLEVFVVSDDEHSRPFSLSSRLLHGTQGRPASQVNASIDLLRALFANA
jgi:hypothetical protein